MEMIYLDVSVNLATVVDFGTTCPQRNINNINCWLGSDLICYRSFVCGRETTICQLGLDGLNLNVFTTG